MIALCMEILHNREYLTFMLSKMAAHSFFRILLGIFIAMLTPLVTENRTDHTTLGIFIAMLTPLVTENSTNQNTLEKFKRRETQAKLYIRFFCIDQQFKNQPYDYKYLYILPMLMLLLLI